MLPLSQCFGSPCLVRLPFFLFVVLGDYSFGQALKTTVGRCSRAWRQDKTLVMVVVMGLAAGCKCRGGGAGLPRTHSLPLFFSVSLGSSFHGWRSGLIIDQPLLTIRHPWVVNVQRGQILAPHLSLLGIIPGIQSEIRCGLRSFQRFTRLAFPFCRTVEANKVTTTKSPKVSVVLPLLLLLLLRPSGLVLLSIMTPWTTLLVILKVAVCQQPFRWHSGKAAALVAGHPIKRTIRVAWWN